VRIAIGAILKNEAPYLLEWIAYHRAIGVREFFLADNLSTDGTSELLADLDRRGWVHRVPFPDPEGGRAQTEAYAHIYETFGSSVDWIAFIDGDEFIVTESADLPTYLSSVVRPDVGAVSLNWAVYGSSGLHSPDGRPVLERLHSRAKRDEVKNLHYKSIVRTGLDADVRHPHHAGLPSGYLNVDSTGNTLAVSETEGISDAVEWRGARINHYVVKSFAEFKAKQGRGRADKSVPPRPDSFFAEHDFNDEFDPVASHLVELMLEERAAIEQDISIGVQERSVGLPAMSPVEIAFYRELLSRCPAVVEFGMGGSTALAAQRTGGVVHSVESNFQWADRVSLDPHVSRAIQNKRAFLHRVDVGRTDNLGYPLDDASAQRWPLYYRSVWGHLRPSAIDMVLVDGRFRVACALTSIAWCRDNALIVIHDFWTREHYHVVLDFTDVVDRVDDLVVLKRSPDIDWRQFALALQDHALDRR
jgi:hypothetical protein